MRTRVYGPLDVRPHPHCRPIFPARDPLPITKAPHTEGVVVGYGSGPDIDESTLEVWRRLEETPRHATIYPASG
jgi:hypothetical protein